MITPKFAEYGETIDLTRLTPLLNCKIKNKASSAPLKHIVRMILNGLEKQERVYEAALVGSFVKYIAFLNKEKSQSNRPASVYDDIDISICIKNEGDSTGTLLKVAEIIQKIWGKNNIHLRSPLFFSPDHSLLKFSLPDELEGTPIQLSFHALASLEQPTFLSNETSFAIPIKCFNKGIGSFSLDEYFIYSKAGPYQQVLKDIENGRISSDVAPFLHGRAWFRILKAITVEDFAFLPPENNRDLFKKDALAKEGIIRNMNSCAIEKKIEGIALVFYAFNALFACLSAEQMLPPDDQQLYDLFIHNVFQQFACLKEDFSSIFSFLNQLEKFENPMRIAFFKKLLPILSEKIELKIHLGEVQVQCSFKIDEKVYYVMVPLLSDEESKLIEEADFISPLIKQYAPKMSELKNHYLMKIMTLSGNEIENWTTEEIKTLLAVCFDSSHLSELVTEILQIDFHNIEKMHGLLSSIHSFCLSEIFGMKLTIHSRFESIHSSLQLQEFSLKDLFEIYDAILHKKPVLLCKLLKKISADHPSILKYLTILLVNLTEVSKKKKMMEEIEAHFPLIWNEILQKIKGTSIQYEVIVFLSDTGNNGAKKECYLQLMDHIEEKREDLLEILPSLQVNATDSEKVFFVQCCLDLVTKIPSIKGVIIFTLESLKNRNNAFKNSNWSSQSVEVLYNLLINEESIEIAIDLLEVYPHLQSISKESFCSLVKQGRGNRFSYLECLEKNLKRETHSDSLCQTLLATYADFSDISEIADFLEKNYLLSDKVHATIQQFQEPRAINGLVKRIHHYISDKKPVLACRLLRYLPKESPESKELLYQLLFQSAKDVSKSKIAQTAVCQYFPQAWPLILEADIHPIQVPELIVTIILNSSEETKKKYFNKIKEKLCDYSAEVEPIITPLLSDLTDLEKWNCVKQRWLLSENKSSETIGKQILKSIINPTSIFSKTTWSFSLFSRTLDFFIEQDIMSEEIAELFYVHMHSFIDQEKQELLSKIFPYLNQEIAEQVIEEQKGLLGFFQTGFLAQLFFIKIKTSLVKSFPQHVDSIRSASFSFFIYHLSSYAEHANKDARELVFQDALECFNSESIANEQKNKLLIQCLTLKDSSPIIPALFSALVANIGNFDLLRNFSVEQIRTGFQILQTSMKAAQHQLKPKEVLENYLTLFIENSIPFSLEFVKNNYWNYFSEKIKAALVLKMENLHDLTSIETASDRMFFVRTFLTLFCDPKMEKVLLKNLEIQKMFNKITLYCLSRNLDINNSKRVISHSSIKKIIQISLLLYKKKIGVHKDFALFASFFHNSEIISDEEFKSIARAISFDDLKEKYKENQRYSVDQKKLWFRVLEFKFRTIQAESKESVENWLSLLQQLPHCQMSLTNTLTPAQFVDFYPMSFSVALHQISYSQETIERMVDHLISMKNHSSSTLSSCCASLIKILPGSEEGKNMHRNLIRGVQLFRLNRNFQNDLDLQLYLQFLTGLCIEEGKSIEEFLKTNHLWFTNETFGKLIQLYDKNTPFGDCIKTIDEDLYIVGALGDVLAGRNPVYPLTQKAATKCLYWLILSMWPQHVNLNNILIFLRYIKQHTEPHFYQNVLNDFQIPLDKEYSPILEDFKTLILTSLLS